MKYRIKGNNSSIASLFSLLSLFSYFSILFSYNSSNIYQIIKYR